MDACATLPARMRLAPLAMQGPLADMLRLMGIAEPRLGSQAKAAVPIWRVREGAALLREGEPAASLFVVRSGSFKCLRTGEDGYEQVVSFVQAGGLLGTQALHGGVHAAGAVALEDATVYALARPTLLQLQHDCPQLHEALWRSLCRQLIDAAETAQMMAAVASDARLARLLLWLSRRMAEAGQSPRRLRLRMSRRDIASLLGVAHETVSRSFTLLADKGLLRVDNREVELLDLHALQQRARCTRGLLAEGGAAPAPGAHVNLPAGAPAVPAPARAVPPAQRWWTGLHGAHEAWGEHDAREPAAA